MKHISSTKTSWTDKKGYSKKILLTPDLLKKPGILVQELRIVPHDSVGPHYHKTQTEIFYFLNTVGVFEVNGKPVPLEPGDVLVVEPNDVHAVRNDSDTDFLYVAFKYNWVEGDYFES